LKAPGFNLQNQKKKKRKKKKEGWRHGSRTRVCLASTKSQVQTPVPQKKKKKKEKLQSPEFDPKHHKQKTRVLTSINDFLWIHNIQVATKPGEQQLSEIPSFAFLPPITPLDHDLHNLDNHNSCFFSLTLPSLKSQNHRQL
jgi:hypothetical protein